MAINHFGMMLREHVQSGAASEESHLPNVDDWLPSLWGTVVLLCYNERK